MNLEERIKLYKTIERGRCGDCGNQSWFDEPESFVCTTCLKTVGKSSFGSMENLTKVTYEAKQVDEVVELIVKVLDTAQIPMPLAICAFDHIMEKIQSKGLVFEKPKVI